MAEETLKGVFCTQRIDSSGKAVVRHWLAWGRDDGNVAVQPLNSKLVPEGQKRIIPEEEFQKAFQEDKDILVEPSTTRVRIWKAKSEMEEPEPTSVTARFREPTTPSKASQDVEKGIRIEFGVALAQLKQGYREKARKCFEALAEAKGDFEPGHKHMFNDFGLGLRKSRMYDTALKHYQRALELSPMDDHILHNMARACYEQGNKGEAIKNLEKSLALNPGLKESRLFLAFINAKSKPLDILDDGDEIKR